jgi:hypothetical protein
MHGAMVVRTCALRLNMHYKRSLHAGGISSGLFAVDHATCPTASSNGAIGSLRYGLRIPFHVATHRHLTRRCSGLASLAAELHIVMPHWPDPSNRQAATARAHRANLGSSTAALVPDDQHWSVAGQARQLPGRIRLSSTITDRRPVRHICKQVHGTGRGAAPPSPYLAGSQPCNVAHRALH